MLYEIQRWLAMILYMPEHTCCCVIIQSKMYHSMTSQWICSLMEVTVHFWVTGYPTDYGLQVSGSEFWIWYEHYSKPQMSLQPLHFCISVINIYCMVYYCMKKMVNWYKLLYKFYKHSLYERMWVCQHCFSNILFL